MQTVVSRYYRFSITKALRIVVSIMLIMVFNSCNLFEDPETDNWVLINRLTYNGNQYDMTGVYVIKAAHSVNLRTDAGIDWGKNRLGSPVAHGNAFTFLVKYEGSSGHHLRVDFDGVDSNGNPLQYFHANALLYSDGNIVHQSINSIVDGSSPWKIDRKIDRNFGK